MKVKAVIGIGQDMANPTCYELSRNHKDVAIPMPGQVIVVPYRPHNGPIQRIVATVNEVEYNYVEGEVVIFGRRTR